MSDAGSVRTLREAIVQLEAATRPIQSEIEQLRRDTDLKIAQLEARVLENHRQLAAWHAAIGADDQSESGNHDPGSGIHEYVALDGIPDYALLAVLQQAGRPLSSRELRAALSVDPSIPKEKFNRLLADVADRGIIVRSGQRRATRYTPPPIP